MYIVLVPRWPGIIAASSQRSNRIALWHRTIALPPGDFANVNDAHTHETAAQDGDRRLHCSKAAATRSHACWHGRCIRLPEYAALKR